MLMQRNFHSKYVIEKLNKIVAMLCGLGNHFVILFDLYNWIVLHGIITL